MSTLYPSLTAVKLAKAVFVDIIVLCVVAAGTRINGSQWLEDGLNKEVRADQATVNAASAFVARAANMGRSRRQTALEAVARMSFASATITQFLDGEQIALRDAPSSSPTTLEAVIQLFENRANLVGYPPAAGILVQLQRMPPSLTGTFGLFMYALELVNAVDPSLGESNPYFVDDLEAVLNAFEAPVPETPVFTTNLFRELHETRPPPQMLYLTRSVFVEIMILCEVVAGRQISIVDKVLGLRASLLLGEAANKGKTNRQAVFEAIARLSKLVTALSCALDGQTVDIASLYSGLASTTDEVVNQFSREAILDSNQVTAYFDCLVKIDDHLGEVLVHAMNIADACDCTLIGVQPHFRTEFTVLYESGAFQSTVPETMLPVPNITYESPIPEVAVITQTLLVEAVGLCVIANGVKVNGCNWLDGGGVGELSANIPISISAAAFLELSLRKERTKKHLAIHILKRAVGAALYLTTVLAGLKPSKPPTLEFDENITVEDLKKEFKEGADWSHPAAIDLFEQFQRVKSPLDGLQNVVSICLNLASASDPMLFNLQPTLQSDIFKILKSRSTEDIPDSLFNLTAVFRNTFRDHFQDGIFRPLFKITRPVLTEVSVLCVLAGGSAIGSNGWIKPFPEPEFKIQVDQFAASRAAAIVMEAGTVGNSKRNACLQAIARLSRDVSCLCQFLVGRDFVKPTTDLPLLLEDVVQEFELQTSSLELPFAMNYLNSLQSLDSSLTDVNRVFNSALYIAIIVNHCLFDFEYHFPYYVEKLVVDCRAFSAPVPDALVIPTESLADCYGPLLLGTLFEMSMEKRLPDIFVQSSLISKSVVVSETFYDFPDGSDDKLLTFDSGIPSLRAWMELKLQAGDTYSILESESNVFRGNGTLRFWLIYTSDPLSSPNCLRMSGTCDMIMANNQVIDIDFRFDMSQAISMEFEKN